MLAEHDESGKIFQEMKEAANAYLGGDEAAHGRFVELFQKYSELLKNHYWKENDILYPMGLRVLTQEDAEGIVKGIEEVEARAGDDTRNRYYALSDEIFSFADVKDLSYDLPRDVIAAILNTLPVELSFVDADDTVRYFNHEGKDKIFARSRAVIGMKVQNCHPQKSIHLVNRILEDFKAGKRDVAEFWIDFRGMKVHIRYFPVRDPSGKYLGCLEVVQDITKIQKLTGERRLLDDQ